MTIQTSKTTIQTLSTKAFPVPSKPSALNLMAAKLSVEPGKLFETLKATVFRNATTEELLALVVVSNEYGLNPFLKEIYAFPAKGGGIVPVVSVDGWNKMLIRQPDFDGIEFEMTDREDGMPYACTATIHMKNRGKSMRITEYFDECKRNTDPWRDMPRRMLRNRTLCQASRMAFGFSGIYHEDEAAAIGVEEIAMPSQPPPKFVVAGDDSNSGLKLSDVLSDAQSSQKAFELLLSSEGFTFEDLRKWMEREEFIKDAGSLANYDDIKPADLQRLIRAKTGVLAGLRQLKEAK